MKLHKFAHLVVLGLVLTIAVSGCKKRPTPLTVLPGARAGTIEGPGPGSMIDSGKTGADTGASGKAVSSTSTEGGVPLAAAGSHDGWTPNSEIFKAYTVYFDFDSSVVKGGERTKAGSVADYLKSHPNTAVRVEGHCDERGTEEYNRALGDRRALAVREELIKMSIEPGRVDTISFGKDKPADLGHDESAWRKNRRGEFILLTPPGT